MRVNSFNLGFKMQSPRKDLFRKLWNLEYTHSRNINSNWWTIEKGCQTIFPHTRAFIFFSLFFFIKVAWTFISDFSFSLLPFTVRTYILMEMSLCKQIDKLIHCRPPHHSETISSAFFYLSHINLNKGPIKFTIPNNLTFTAWLEEVKLLATIKFAPQNPNPGPPTHNQCRKGSKTKIN